MDAAGRMEIIRELCSFERRLTGTDSERRAANRMGEHLREQGRRVEVEPIHVHPQYALVHAVHCLLGFAGSLVAVEIPALGFALVLLAATSMYLDLNHRLFLIRSLFFRRASQNVVSRGGCTDAGARLIVCAHLDASRGGAVFAPARTRRLARLAHRLRIPLGPFRILFWSLALLVPLLGLRMAGVDSTLVSVLQLVPTLVLLIGAFALIDVQLSRVSVGASDNASGVSAAISLSAELTGSPPEHLDVWVVLLGGGESLQEGMRAFLRTHRRDLDREATFVCALDCVGAGEPRFLRSGGWAVSYAMDRRLIELSEAIALADAEGGARLHAAAYASGAGGSAVAARIRGLRAIGISCRDGDGLVANQHQSTDVPENVDPEALDRAHEFALELIRRLDADVGRRLAR